MYEMTIANANAYDVFGWWVLFCPYLMCLKNIGKIWAVNDSSFGRRLEWCRFRRENSSNFWWDGESATALPSSGSAIRILPLSIRFHSLQRIIKNLSINLQGDCNRSRVDYRVRYKIKLYVLSKSIRIVRFIVESVHVLHIHPLDGRMMSVRGGASKI